ncbi:hypothetical protein AeRB84_021558 [Aphanomyces euteiches]|nr:hypothetical protein AeRB84_021558 [Aphanomyces euteiches]
MPDSKGPSEKPHVSNAMFSLIHNISGSNDASINLETAPEPSVSEMEEHLKDPELLEIMDKWWKSSLSILDTDGNGTLERNEYVNLYKRLIYGTSCIYGEKAVITDDIDELIEEDWKRDSGGHLSIDKTRLCVSIYELAETWARGKAVETYVDFLTGKTNLYEYVFVLYKEEYISGRKPSRKSSSPPKQKATIQKEVAVTPAPKPKRSSVSSRRVTQVQTPSIEVLPPSPAIPPPEPQPIEPKDDKIHQASSDEDPAYYSFEARLELQERIEACQRKLQNISHPAEIAWLRCTIREEKLSEKLPNESIEPYPITATGLTELGEKLCKTLLECIQNAEKARVSELVEMVNAAEHDVQEFVGIVNKLAHGCSSVQEIKPTKQPSTKQFPGKLRPRHTESHEELCFGKHTVTFDLPSMKTYCLNVAPSYKAYPKHSS